MWGFITLYSYTGRGWGRGAESLGLMHLICHYLIWWPQVSHLASGPQRELHSVSEFLQTRTSCAGRINLTTATSAQSEGMRAHDSWTLRQTLHFIKQRTLLSTLQTLKQPRLVTGWPQVTFFGWNIEDFKRGSHALWTQTRRSKKGEHLCVG